MRSSKISCTILLKNCLEKYKRYNINSTADRPSSLLSCFSVKTQTKFYVISLLTLKIAENDDVFSQLFVFL